ncbi:MULTISPECIES: DUF58 domain-containing protein [unclassified Emticicia]|uniref:DUF58 domain-containing protein n=1 Tax=unclassified Emticicia TaxID=2627301 RepID=UPI000C769149|nr:MULTISPECIES: DUF58 domain-containing protein [unclassified Emticicia]PLK42726.1 DUF58 domain-containing protein [Emticicia sp. TH156]UTA67472.1 DUF58 domain-containing protein [Emticicia sp. 21SJ11W-3]
MVEDIISKLNKYEIKIRKAVDSQMHGNFRSVFKGSGLEFSDLRTYQYGDDVRAIDWITTAKGHGAYVKIFKEEKEQTVFFMLDVSASQEVGNNGQLKLDTAKEICGVLSLSAIKEAGHVGLYCFSDQKELYFKPSNGMKHGYEIILSLFKMKPLSQQTDITSAIGFALNILKRRSVVFLISDFLDNNYEHNLKALARKHDLVVIHIYDQREIKLPSLGIIPVLDKESKKTVWLNTSSPRFKREMKEMFENNQERLEKLCKQHNANYLAIDSREDYVSKLIQLFRVRK